MEKQNEEKMRLLLVVTHPHDFTHAAGTCANHVADGDEVTVVSVTGGGATHNERLFDELKKPANERDMSILSETPEEYVNKKTLELRKAAELFGVTDVHVLPFSDDPAVKYSKEMVEAIVEFIYKVRPHIIMCHAPFETGLNSNRLITDVDHVQVGLATHEAIKMAGKPDYKNHREPHENAITYYFGMECAFQDVDLMIDISEHAEKRLQAENCFVSQGHASEDYCRKRTHYPSFWGMFSGSFSYAEVFILARPRLASKLTPTKEEMLHYHRSHAERMKKLAKLI